MAQNEKRQRERERDPPRAEEISVKQADGCRGEREKEKERGGKYEVVF